MFLIFSAFIGLLLLLTLATERTYNESDANRTLNFAYGAYCPQSELESWSCKWCKNIPDFQVLIVPSANSLQAFVGYDIAHNTIVVSFRGTHNAEDWLDDFEYQQVAYPGISNGYVHKGFYTAWINTLHDPVMNGTKTLMNKYPNAEQLMITGHSLGGSIAQIAALDIWNSSKANNFANKINLYTYGSPRWGNAVMAKYFESIIDWHWRLVNMKDIIPTVPFQSLGKDGYHHTAIEIWYTSDVPLNYTQCDGSGEDWNCSYFGYSLSEHLRYLDVHESCS